jgi:hypothetical protein
MWSGSASPLFGKWPCAAGYSNFDFSGEHNVPISSGTNVQDERMDFSTLEDTDKNMPQNVGIQLHSNAVSHSNKTEYSN